MIAVAEDRPAVLSEVGLHAFRHRVGRRLGDLVGVNGPAASESIGQHGVAPVGRVVADERLRRERTEEVGFGDFGSVDEVAFPLLQLAELADLLDLAPSWLLPDRFRCGRPQVMFDLARTFGFSISQHCPLASMKTIPDQVMLRPWSLHQPIAIALPTGPSQDPPATTVTGIGGSS